MSNSWRRGEKMTDYMTGAKSKKSEYLQIRISETIKTALKVKADQTGMNVSEYVRLLILEDVRKTFNVDFDENKPKF